MGWAGGTEIFDVVVEAVLEDAPKEEIIERLIEVMEDHDWDVQSESEFWEHPVVRKIFMDRNPEWFDVIPAGYKGGNGELVDSGCFYGPYVPLMSSDEE